MFMLIVLYNGMCSSVSTVFFFAPTEFIAENEQNVEQETPKKRPAVAEAEVLLHSVQALSVELSVGRAVNADLYSK
jgi:hypothetical protein